MRFEPVIALPNAWTSALGQFVLHLFEGHLSLDDMDQIRALGARWLARNAKPRVELVVIMPSGARMSLEERQCMVQLIKQGELSRTASATVILAEGMLGSVQRSVLTGLQLLSAPPHPTKVFAQVDPALRWLHPSAHALMPKLELETLLAAVDMRIDTFRTRTEMLASL